MEGDVVHRRLPPAHTDDDGSVYSGAWRTSAQECHQVSAAGGDSARSSLFDPATSTPVLEASEQGLEGKGQGARTAKPGQSVSNTAASKGDVLTLPRAHCAASCDGASSCPGGGTPDPADCKLEQDTVDVARTRRPDQGLAEDSSVECTCSGVCGSDRSVQDECVPYLHIAGCPASSVPSYGGSTRADADEKFGGCLAGGSTSAVSGLMCSHHCCKPLQACSGTEAALETGGVNGGDADAAGVPPYMRIDRFPSLLVGTEGASGGVPGGLALCGGRAQLPATPFSLHKFVLVCIYMLYAFLTGCVYFGWPSLSYMMFRSGAYSWLCEQKGGELSGDSGSVSGGGTTQSAGGSSAKATEGSSTLSDSSLENGSADNAKHYLCDEQDAAVSPLFTICYVTQSLMSVVAGTLLDHVSPKKAAMLGQAFNGIGWTLLARSSQQFPAYIPAMVFIGLGADTAYLPTLLIATLFPGRRATVITLLGAANTSSFAVPLILETVWTRLAPWWAFSDVCLLYLCVGPIFCFFLAALFIPFTAFGKTSSTLCPHRGQELTRPGDLLSRITNCFGKCRTREGRALYSDGAKEGKVKNGFGPGGPATKSVKAYVWGIASCPRFATAPFFSKCRLSKRGQRKGSAPTGTQDIAVGSGGCRGDHRITVETVGLGAGQAGTRGGFLEHGSSSAGDPQTARILQGCTEENATASKPRLVDCPAPSADACREGNIGCDGAALPGNPSNATVLQSSARRWLSPRWFSRSGALHERKRLPPKATQDTQRAEGRLVTARHVTDDMKQECGGCVGVPECAGRCTSLLPCAVVGAPTGSDLVDKELDQRGAAAQSVSQGLKETGVEEVVVEAEGKHENCCIPSECCCFMGGDVEHEAGGSCTCTPNGSGRCQRQLGVDDGEATEISVLERCYSGRDFRDKKRRLIGTKADGRKRRKDAECGLEASTRPNSLGRGVEPSFWSQTCSSHFVCITLYWSCQAIATSFLQSAANRLFSPTVVDFMDVALSFSFVPCVLLGKTIDVFGPFPVLVLVNTAGVLAYVFAIVGDPGNRAVDALRYVAVMCFCVYIAVDSEQVFCYVQNTFSPKHFGKLSGLALTLGGVISFVSIPLYDSVTIRTLKGNAFPVALAISFVLAVVYVMLGVMWFVRSRNPQPFNVLPVALAAAAPSSNESFFSGDEPRPYPSQTPQCTATPTTQCVSGGDASEAHLQGEEVRSLGIGDV